MENMSHIDAIEREIARLDSLAKDIDDEAALLVYEMETEMQNRPNRFGTPENPYYSIFVFKPNDSQNVRKRKLAANYEDWYNSANELVHAYLPNRARDFENEYKDPNGGLYYDIRFNQDFKRPDDKFKAAVSIRSQLDCQRNILNSIPNAIKVRSMDLLVVISHDLVNSEIDLAYHILKKDKTHEYCLRVAGILAGIALERHLKTRCESETGSLPDNPTLSPLIDTLYKANKITLNQKKYLEAIATTRNDCAHATASVDRTMVGEAISNVKKHLEGNL
jgi:hypothetical protein